LEFSIFTLVMNKLKNCEKSEKLISLSNFQLNSSMNLVLETIHICSHVG
jgi:hypothetical protein